MDCKATIIIIIKLIEEGISETRVGRWVSGTFLMFGRGLSEAGEELEGRKSMVLDYLHSEYQSNYS